MTSQRPAKSSPLPTIDVRERQPASRSKTLGRAVKRFLDHGCVLIRGAFSPINAVTGTIRLWPGSQTLPVSCVADRTPVDPGMSLGDCLLVDDRLLHRGTANRSEHLRPLLYLVYQHPWFRDSGNYAQPAPITISEREYARVPARFRFLLDWLGREGRPATRAPHPAGIR
jgi:ectoine hydroxylase-related dioxygenase (phytanoyl-CoA dioxygenase family)